MSPVRYGLMPNRSPDKITRLNYASRSLFSNHGFIKENGPVRPDKIFPPITNDEPGGKFPLSLLGKEVFSTNGFNELEPIFPFVFAARLPGTPSVLPRTFFSIVL